MDGSERQGFALTLKVPLWRNYGKGKESRNIPEDFKLLEEELRRIPLRVLEKAMEGRSKITLGPSYHGLSIMPCWKPFGCYRQECHHSSQYDSSQDEYSGGCLSWWVAKFHVHGINSYWKLSLRSPTSEKPRIHLNQSNVGKGSCGGLSVWITFPEVFDGGLRPSLSVNIHFVGFRGSSSPIHWCLWFWGSWQTEAGNKRDEGGLCFK